MGGMTVRRSRHIRQTGSLDQSGVEDDSSNGSEKLSNNVFRLRKFRGRRSISLPLEDSKGNMKTQQKQKRGLKPLRIWRKSYPPGTSTIEDKDSTSEDSSAEEIRDGPNSSSDEEGKPFKTKSNLMPDDDSAIPEEGNGDDNEVISPIGERSVTHDAVFHRTHVIPHSTSPIKLQKADSFEAIALNQESTSGYCATAILQHSYLENICGGFTYSSNDSLKALPEDPTVQESIECIFASQLAEGVSLWDDDEDNDDDNDDDDNNNVYKRNGQCPSLLDKPDDLSKPHKLVSPASLLQSRQNRSDRKQETSSISQSKKRYQQASLVYVGTFDPTIPDDDKTVMTCCDDPLPCPCKSRRLPLVGPEGWPQAPLLLRPTPGGGTVVKGVRFGNSKDHFWVPDSHLTWEEALANHWGVPYEKKERIPCCGECAALPVNNGNEENGESIVIDFESELFIGSLQLRLRYSHGTTKEPYDDNKGYFSGMNRRYQTIIRGRFKKSIPFTELMTGFDLQRQCGKLPPKWILRGGQKVLTFFAPQLQAQFEGKRPYSYTPLGSTPQSILVATEEEDKMEDVREEPTDPKKTLLGEAYEGATTMQRARQRKKAFDKLFVQKSRGLRTDPSKIYTFEFLQHLFNFQEFSIELGSMLGSVYLKDVLDGQPLQIMSTHGNTRLWSFDVWHECLWEAAKKHGC